MNIVLDIDETLVTCVSPKTRRLQKRPFLDTFLHYCFTNFDTVSIWTAATREWYEYVYCFVFEPMLARFSAVDQRHYRFAFVYTREHCETYNQQLVKPLKNLFARKDGFFSEITRHNTLVVDDRATTFALNIKNAIHVPAFILYGYNDKTRLCMSRDNTLYKLMKFLMYLVHVFRNTTRDVRATNKRLWLNASYAWNEHYIRLVSNAETIVRPIPLRVS